MDFPSFLATAGDLFGLFLALMGEAVWKDLLEHNVLQLLPSIDSDLFKGVMTSNLEFFPLRVSIFGRRLIEWIGQRPMFPY